jgi:hypothetical protein
MKTTIFSADLDQKRKTGVIIPVIQLLNLILAGSYLVMILLLLFSPVRHGYGGVSGGGGNSVNLSIPSFYILFSLLIIVHLVSLYQSRLPWHMIMAHGLGMLISATLTLSLLFFVRQSVNLLQSTYPVPFLVYGSLILSFLLGMYVVTELVRKRNPVEGTERKRTKYSFPLPENQYRKVRILAEGGVGMIWYAERIDDDMPVVVKVPRRDDEKTGISFMQEINVWKDLDHPHIAAVLSANILPLPYIEIEYLPGSLAEIEKPVSLIRAVQIIRSLVSALSYAHDRGVAHCDIKPSNILLTNDGVPKLTDWGLSRSGSPRWSVSGFSPRYAAPEQYQLTPDCGFATDIWQIGMVFAELLTGRVEIPSGTEPVFLQPGGADLLQILEKCLARDPGDRYPSAKALLEELKQDFSDLDTV